MSGYQIVIEGKFFFNQRSQLINAEQMIELENHNFAIPNGIMDLSNNQQWLLLPLGKRLMENYNRWT